MENYNIPEENETDNALKPTAPVRSWKDLLHEILATNGPDSINDEDDEDDKE